MGLPDSLFGGAYNGLLDDRSMAAAERTGISRLDFLARLEAINPATLGPDARRARESMLFMLDAVAAVETHGYGSAELGRASPYLISFADGAYTDLPKFMTLHVPVRSRADANDWLKRLDSMDEALRDERRRFVPNAQIPHMLQQAVLAVEDSRFHQHPGIDAGWRTRHLEALADLETIVE